MHEEDMSLKERVLSLHFKCNNGDANSEFLIVTSLSGTTSNHEHHISVIKESLLSPCSLSDCVTLNKSRWKRRAREGMVVDSTVGRVVMGKQYVEVLEECIRVIKKRLRVFLIRIRCV
ncbi:hypothetical protein ACOSQ3_031641 [Xanthoceras sorbifolium]